jgi:hypothetical protein
VEGKNEMNTTWKFLILVTMVFYSSFAQAKAWRGIEPLHSTREDVERLFGSKVVRCGGSACIYDLGEEIIFVLYATDSNCKNDDATTAWKVPVGTVIEIGVRFKEDKLLSDLQFDLSKFERVEDKHLPGWIYYLNVDEGVRVEGGLKTASSVTYFQKAKDNYLRCKSVKQAKATQRIHSYHHQEMTNYPSTCFAHRLLPNEIMLQQNRSGEENLDAFNRRRSADTSGSFSIQSVHCNILWRMERSNSAEA